jgi:phage replication-related protein YjqB (UPF0714/DUF867 family)
MLRRNEIETAYAALFIPNADRFSNHHSREHCSANRHQIRMMGLNPGQQVRIERPTASGTTIALYTIIDAHDEESNSVFVDYKDPDDVEKRFGLPGTGSFQGKINAQVAAVDLTDAEAEAYSEFIEHLADDDYNNKLVVIAPHGGNIEEHTDEQAEHVAEQLSSKSVSVWMCKGFKKGGGAFNRWHITSTDISEESFPKLKTIYGRHFKYAIAFHGWSGDSICIGGSSQDPEDHTKEEIKEAIEDVVHGSEIGVAMGGPACPENFNANDPKNIVNRLGTTGVQIEQCERARDDYGSRIAEAVANVIRPKLTV